MERWLAKARSILGWVVLGLAGSLVSAACGLAAGSPSPPDFDRIADPALSRVVLFVGDGMGYGSVEAAGYFSRGAPGSLVMESLPHGARVRTASASWGPTDSAAAATAMATGAKVKNGAVSVALPGDGASLRTVLEHHRDRGRATGLVTTSYVYDATPAAFAAHAPTRSDYGVVDGGPHLRRCPPVRLGTRVRGGDGSPRERRHRLDPGRSGPARRDSVIDSIPNPDLRRRP